MRLNLFNVNKCIRSVAHVCNVCKRFLNTTVTMNYHQVFARKRIRQGASSHQYSWVWEFRVNWNQLEPHTTDVRVTIKVLSLYVWWQFIVTVFATHLTWAQFHLVIKVNLNLAKKLQIHRNVITSPSPYNWIF